MGAARLAKVGQPVAAQAIVAQPPTARVGLVEAAQQVAVAQEVERVMELQQVAPLRATHRSSHNRLNSTRSSRRTWSISSQRKRLPGVQVLLEVPMVMAVEAVVETARWVAPEQPQIVAELEPRHSWTRRSCHRIRHRQGFVLGRKDRVSFGFSFG